MLTTQDEHITPYPWHRTYQNTGLAWMQSSAWAFYKVFLNGKKVKKEDMGIQIWVGIWTWAKWASHFTMPHPVKIKSSSV